MHSPVIARAALALLLLSLALFAAADEPAPAQPLDAETMAALGIAPQSGGWSWTSGEYAYDGSGNITAIGATQSFAYDVRGRLTNATLTRPDQPGSRTHSYAYDAFGNLTSRVEEGTTIATPASSSTNHLTANSAVYDAAGNVTQVQPAGPGFVYEYTYDALGTMKQLRVSNLSGENRQLYVYTAGDERIWTYDIGANLSSWKIRGLDGKVLRDFTDDGLWSLSRDYIYRDGQLLAAITPTQTLYFSLDHLGTSRVVTDAGRVRVGFHHYFPFGQEWLDSSGAQEGEPMKFTGHERDRDGAGAGGPNGLDYMHARYYAAVLGRFLSVDPTSDSADLATPQSLNRYSYVHNNPVNATDPTGKILKLVGTRSLQQDVQRIANARLHNVDLAISRDGTARLVPNNAQGPPSLEQAAMATTLSDVIGKTPTTSISLTSNSTSIIMDDFNAKTIDVADISALGEGAGVSASGVLGHAVTEQYQGQVLGQGYPAAHAEGNRSENAINGTVRGEGSPRIDGNGNGTIVMPATRGRETTTTVITLRNLNVICVDRR